MTTLSKSGRDKGFGALGSKGREPDLSESAVKQPHPQAVSRFDLTDRVAWVPGGAGLLGTAVCRALAEHGAHVIVSDIRGDAAEKNVGELRDAGLRAEATQIDIGNERSVIDQVEQIVARHRRIDILVNMTYQHTKSSMERLTAAEWNEAIGVTLTGAFVVTREVGRVMGEQGGGSIIHFSSMYGIVSPDPRMYPPTQRMNPVDYGVAKAGILQLVRYQAVVLAPNRVRVNAVAPGPFPFPTTHGTDGQFMARLKDKVPMGRVGKPEEITGAIVFLASDAASFITGTNITVDGGWTAW
jgi:NAD(P)-dependent dehydrogenase (short-subunit alcohol dehydrogenase family)